MTPEQIKKIRKDRKLSVREFAEKIAVSPRTVEGWEQGRNISRQCIFIIQKIFFNSFDRVV